MRTPPWPVAVAAGILALVTLGMLATVIAIFVAGGAPWAVALLVVVAVLALTTDGLWRGRRGARPVACILAAFFVLFGVQRLNEGDVLGLLFLVSGGLVLAAVTLPRASRAWFTA